MANVLIAAYLLIVLALIGVILLQRSEGGALGIGGGNSQFGQVRTTANVLTRTTAILAVLFFATAIGLTILSELDRGTSGILDSAGQGQQPTSVLDALNSIGGGAAGNTVAPVAPAVDPALPVPATPAAPVTTPAAPVTAPAEPAPAAPATEPVAATPAAPADAATPASVPVTPAPAEPAAAEPATPAPVTP
jgi:preprotein translocase subunit SecG